MLAEELYRVFKDCKTVPFLGQPISSPLGVLGRKYMSFGMGHQAQNPSGWIANPGDIAHGAVGVIWKRGSWFAGLSDIAQHNLVGLFQTVEDPGLAGDKIAFAVCHGDKKPGDAFKKRAISWIGFQVNPTGAKSTGSIGGKGGGGAFFILLNNKACFKEDLKAVANSKKEFIGVPEGAEFCFEKMGNLGGQDFASGNIVPIGKPTGNHQNLELLQKLGLFPKLKDVNPFRLGPRLFKGKMGFHVTVGTGCSQN